MQKLENVNVSLLLDREGYPFGDVVIFRSGGYYRRYSFTPRLKHVRGISRLSMLRAQAVQQKMMARPCFYCTDGCPHCGVGSAYQE